jgi:hypothetical protein
MADWRHPGLAWAPTGQFKDCADSDVFARNGKPAWLRLAHLGANDVVYTQVDGGSQLG